MKPSKTLSNYQVCNPGNPGSKSAIPHGLASDSPLKHPAAKLPANAISDSWSAMPARIPQVVVQRKCKCFSLHVTTSCAKYNLLHFFWNLYVLHEGVVYMHVYCVYFYIYVYIYIYAYACIQYTYVFLYRCIYSYMYIYIHVWYARTSTLEGCASHDPGAASHCMVQCSKKKFVPTKSQSKCLHVLRRTCTRQTRTYYVFLWTNWILCHSILEMVSYSIGWRNIT